MASKKDPNGFSNDTKLKILGYDIYFPGGRKPFPPQLALMSQTLQALSKGENAILESPTGTGKTLALLTSILSWKKAFDIDFHNQAKERILLNKTSLHRSDNLTNTTSDVHSETDIVSAESKEDYETAPRPSTDTPITTVNNTSVVDCEEALLKKPQIFYCSRTHSQLQQVVDELRSCSSYYTSDIKTCVLASRARTCIHKDLMKSVQENGGSLDEECRALLKTMSCRFERKVGDEWMDASHSLGIWDIEELVAYGKKKKCCPYFLTRNMLIGADIIFCPYNFVLDQAVLDAMKVDLKSSVVVFDEAHNIEDIARSSATFTITSTLLSTVAYRLSILSKHGETAYEKLYELIQKLVFWVEEVSTLIERNVGTNVREMIGNIGKSSAMYLGGSMNGDPYECMPGDEALVMFDRKLGLNTETIQIFNHYMKEIESVKDDVNEIIKQIEDDGAGDDTEGNAKNDAEEETLSNGHTSVIKGFLSVCQMMMKPICNPAVDFRLIIQLDRNSSSGSARESTLTLLCLNAALPFDNLKSCRSIILASGTLSPLDSFSSELGVKFSCKLEANHVIDVNSQVWAGAFASIQSVPMNSTYSNKDNVAHHDALGLALLAITRITPGGVLMFFPSYTMIDKVLQRWEGSGLLKELQNGGKVRNTRGKLVKRKIRYFVEPRDSKAVDSLLQEYYQTIDSLGGKAVLFAVCRGKISEGINFSDEYARSVIVCGIPYPAVKDLQVQLKREFQDVKASQTIGHELGQARNGSQWYSLQAFRAMNQCIGRCIRHKNDFGAVIFLENRLCPRNPNDSRISMLSKWVRNQVKKYDDIDASSILSLQTFFEDNVKRRRNDRYLEFFDSTIPPLWETRDVLQEVAEVEENDNNEESEVSFTIDRNGMNDKMKETAIGKAFSRITAKPSESKTEVINIVASPVVIRSNMIHRDLAYENDSTRESSGQCIENISSRGLFEDKMVENKLGPQRTKKLFDVTSELIDKTIVFSIAKITKTSLTKSHARLSCLTSAIGILSNNWSDVTTLVESRSDDSCNKFVQHHKELVALCIQTDASDISNIPMNRRLESHSPYIGRDDVWNPEDGVVYREYFVSLHNVGASDGILSCTESIQSLQCVDTSSRQPDCKRVTIAYLVVATDKCKQDLFGCMLLHPIAMMFYSQRIFQANVLKTDTITTMESGPKEICKNVTSNGPNFSALSNIEGVLDHCPPTHVPIIFPNRGSPQATMRREQMQQHDRSTSIPPPIQSNQPLSNTIAVKNISIFNDDVSRPMQSMQSPVQIYGKKPFIHGTTANIGSSNFDRYENIIKNTPKTSTVKKMDQDVPKSSTGSISMFGVNFNRQSIDSSTYKRQKINSSENVNFYDDDDFCQ